MSEDACIYCAAPADRWCDYSIGFDNPSGDGLHRIEEKRYRCDAPLCLKHAAAAGTIFWPAAFGGPDTVDWCIGHAPDERHFDTPLTAVEADRVRYRHRCGAVGLRLVAKEPG